MNKALRKSVNMPIQSAASDLFNFKSPHYKKFIEEWDQRIAGATKLRKRMKKAGLTLNTTLTVIDSIQGPMLSGKGSMTMTYKVTW